MAMMLDSHAEHFEGMHADAGVLDPLLAFEDHVDRASEQTNERVAL